MQESFDAMGDRIEDPEVIPTKLSRKNPRGNLWETVTWAMLILVVLYFLFRFTN